jgi:hypothetical protein
MHIQVLSQTNKDFDWFLRKELSFYWLTRKKLFPLLVHFICVLCVNAVGSLHNNNTSPAVVSTNGNKNKCDIETEMKRMAYTGWLKQTIGNRHVLGVSVKVSD